MVRPPSFSRALSAGESGVVGVEDDPADFLLRSSWLDFARSLSINILTDLARELSLVSFCTNGLIEEA